MIGAAIKNYLDANGIKQAFVAEKVGITPGQMSDICNNGRKTIDCVLYYKICRALNVPLDLFFEGLEV
jgi:transcriptional regulator with XRE-family HTH domain